MKVMPTLEGGLRIDIESSSDWLVLEQIPTDAVEEKLFSLPEELAALMDDDSDWDSLVAPELADLFSGQVDHVAEAVAKAAADGEDESGEIFIPREDARDWYGALNQARLALENRWGFSGSEEEDVLVGAPLQKRSAFIRSQFYLILQGLLLDYAMD